MFFSKLAFCQVQSGTAHYPPSLPSSSQPCKPHQTSSSSFQPAFFPRDLITAPLRAFRGSAQLWTLPLVGLSSLGISLLLFLGCGLLQTILHSLLSPGPLLPLPLLQSSFSSLIPHSDLHPRPWTGNFTACYNFAFVIRSPGQTSKAPFSLLPLSRFYNRPQQCNLHFLNLELPDFYLGRQDTPAS